MRNSLTPESGRWYKRRDDGNSFEVLFVDAEEGAIEIRHFDGAIELLDLSSWQELILSRREPPQRLCGRAVPLAVGADRATAGQTRWTGPLDWTGTED